MALAATAEDAVSTMQRAVNSGSAPRTAVSEGLAGSVCAGAAARETTIALITTAQDLGIPDSEIGAGLGLGASLAEDCSPESAEATARVVGDMGTIGLRNAFIAGIEAGGGSEVLGRTAMSDPTVAFGGVAGYFSGPVDISNPCDRPGCN